MQRAECGWHLKGPFVEKERVKQRLLYFHDVISRKIKAATSSNLNSSQCSINCKLLEETYSQAASCAKCPPPPTPPTATYLLPVCARNCISWPPKFCLFVSIGNTSLLNGPQAHVGKIKIGSEHDIPDAVSGRGKGGDPGRFTVRED
jgi:hypothetical protein